MQNNTSQDFIRPITTAGNDSIMDPDQMDGDSKRASSNDSMTKPTTMQSRINKSSSIMQDRIKLRQKNRACLKSPSSVHIPAFSEAFKVTGINKNTVQQT